MGGFLVVITMVTGTASFIALFRPLPRIGLPTRKRAAGVWAASWVLLVIGGALLPGPTQEEAAEAARAGADRDAPPPPPPNPNRWSMINFVDEFGDITGRGAISADVGSLRPMAFPYHAVTAQVFVDCNRAWIRFSDAPNLNGGDIQDGYTRYRATVRVDGERIGSWLVSQVWGDNDLAFVNDSQAISALSSGSTLAISVDWYGEGAVAFELDLEDSSDRIGESCE